MTNSVREEIEIARNVLNDHSASVKIYGPAHPLVVAIAKEILTQVEKARAEERESIAVYLEGTETWEGREFAKTIRGIK